MLRSPWKPMVCIAAGGLLALAFGVPSALHAEAADAGGTDAEPVDRLVADQLTREQLAGMYAGLSGATYQPPACTAGQPRMFTDVPASNPFCPWIEELARRGITGGCTTNQYCPGDAVTRSQMAIFIVRSMEACPTLDPTDEMIRVGGVCIDKYEASLWDAPVGGNQIIADEDSDYCNPNGQDCDNIYARSVAGVEPAHHITWFQAQAALRNSGKRLPTNAEWQMAALGTPDGVPCNVASGGLVVTGSSPGCVSSAGVLDMVGNLWEWVADWDEVAAGCELWPTTFGDDLTCVGRGDGDATDRFPGALFRGGDFSSDFSSGSNAGPFAVVGLSRPSDSGSLIGFRGAR